MLSSANKANASNGESERQRNRVTNFIVPHDGIKRILKNAGPRLQFQFNDSNNKCIGESWVLEPEYKVVDRETLFQTKFIPITKDIGNLTVPPNAKSIIIFGQQGKFTTIDSAIKKFGLGKKHDFDTYNPTCGIEISGPIYLITPMRLVLTGFNLETNSLSVNPFNDIIKSIQIEDGVFKSLETIEPLIIIG